MEDSLNSETGQKNTTVAYFNVTIGALQQSNIVDLMAAAIIPANSDHIVLHLYKSTRWEIRSEMFS